MIEINRRQLLGGIGAAALLGVGAAACGSGDSGDTGGGATSADSGASGAAGGAASGATSAAPGSGAPTSASGGGLKLPTFTAFTGVKADLPATAGGVPAGFLSFPDPVQGITAKPAQGGEISVMTEVGAAPAPMSSNKWWQALNDHLGATVKWNLVNEGQYRDKASVVVAGGDIPDMMQLHPDMSHLPDLLKAKFADLTEFLAGDAIKDYPFLANLPSYVWPNAVYNGGIYGVPFALAPVGAIMFSRRDLLDKMKLSDDVASGKDFFSLCKEVTDAKSSRWAGSSPTGFLSYALEMVGAPVGWAQDGGKFTSQYETDQYRQALSIIADQWKAGIFHPDSFAFANAGAEKPIVLFAAGTTLFDMRNNTWWTNYYTQYAPSTPGFTIDGMPPMKYDGGGLGQKSLGSGIYTITAIKKASKDKIQQMLRIMNFTAAPFGTKEYVFNRYGVEGVDYNLVKGEPKATKQAATDSLPISYIAARPPVLYNAGLNNVTQANYAYQQKVLPTGATDATNGLISTTDSNQGASLTKTLADMVNQVIQGRKSLNDWDTAVKNWRSAGGDAMRKEYEEAFSAR